MYNLLSILDNYVKHPFCSDSIDSILTVVDSWESIPNFTAEITDTWAYWDLVKISLENRLITGAEVHRYKEETADELYHQDKEFIKALCKYGGIHIDNPQPLQFSISPIKIPDNPKLAVALDEALIKGYVDNVTVLHSWPCALCKGWKVLSSQVGSRRICFDCLGIEQ